MEKSQFIENARVAVDAQGQEGREARRDFSAHPDDPFTEEQWKSAGQMYLRSEAQSDRAKFLIGLIFSDHVAPRLGVGQGRHTSRIRQQRAIGAILADLLKLFGEGSVGSHGTAPKDFPMSVLGFGRNIFMQVKDAMEAAGLLLFRPGAPRWMTWKALGEGADTIGRGKGWVARFALTPLAIDLATAAGVSPDDWDEHWGRARPVRALLDPGAVALPLVELRAEKTRTGKDKQGGEELPVPFEHPRVRSFVEDLQKHNAFLMKVGVEGADFIGLRRIFSAGGQSTYAWNKGGRFYSRRMSGMDRPYESLSGVDRRRQITLGGERVGEADVQASQLRLLYAIWQERLPSELADDPYSIKTLDRDAVKAWITLALGKGSVLSKRWGQAAEARYQRGRPGRTMQADFPFAEYRELIVSRHPILRRLDEPGALSVLDLQYQESEVLRGAMASLRRQGIPSLPVHDSLMAPVSRLGVVAHELKSSFIGVVSHLTGIAPEELPPVKLKEPLGVSQGAT